jgi:hypothetical protein
MQIVFGFEDIHCVLLVTKILYGTLFQCIIINEICWLFFLCTTIFSNKKIPGWIKKNALG